MGKMKEVFIEEMNNRVDMGDEDSDYESYQYRDWVDGI